MVEFLKDCFYAIGGKKHCTFVLQMPKIKGGVIFYRSVTSESELSSFLLFLGAGVIVVCLFTGTVRFRAFDLFRSGNFPSTLSKKTENTSCHAEFILKRFYSAIVASRTKHHPGGMFRAR